MNSSVSSSAIKYFIYVTLALFFLLQGRLWFSDDGWPEVIRLRASVASQESENAKFKDRNLRLTAEVSDLKNGFEALEERARSDLGMIGPQESFFIWSSEVLPEANSESSD
ncbi:MAG: septum formation initiator family protein [Pseudomonadota bacterium]|nr:septum formation initiator family protein [Pseudomonadota bacterium]